MREKTGRYIDPLTDFGFKHLFGTEPNKKIMIEFLNVLFEGQKHIVDIAYNDTESAGDTMEYKKVIFDLACTGDQGEQFIIEMQRATQKYFRERCLFYLSRMINQQLPKGESSWNIVLKEVYLIGVLDFSFEDTQEGEYFHNICLMNSKTSKLFYDKIGFKFLELPNFNKKAEELTDNMDKWFYLLKNMHHLDKIPASLDTPLFQKIFRIAEIANLTKEERMLYNSNLKAKWDYENTIAYAEELAENRGKIRGEIKGEIKTKNKIAAELKKIGMSIEDISNITQLTFGEIGEL
ncbi:MAG TPA: Rpn family recombination-promoting nuclease/putative transposase [Pedobacter sp.]